MDDPHPPTEQVLVQRAVDRVAESTGFSLSFAGFVTEHEIQVSAFAGTRTRSLMGLRVREARGLGGLVMLEGRPRITKDYGSSQKITHDYDRAVLGEGVASLFAVPVPLGGRVHAVLYGGAHGLTSPETLATGPVLRIAQELATEFRVHDLLVREFNRLGMILPAEQLAEASRAGEASPELSSYALEEIRASYAELRGIRARVEDAQLRGRIQQLGDRLAALAVEDGAPVDPGVRLSPRERDVLSWASIGHTNAQISRTLGLRENTVKSYLSTAMNKLNTRTRYAAVSTARRLHIIP